MQLKYSQQAKMIIANLKDFDEKDFMRWYFGHSVGGSYITGYVVDKETAKGGKHGL